MLMLKTENIKITIIKKSSEIGVVNNEVDESCNLSVGDSWRIEGGKKPEGFCQAAWDSIISYSSNILGHVSRTNCEGADQGDFYIVSCCNGLSPVLMKIESLEQEECFGNEILKDEMSFQPQNWEFVQSIDGELEIKSYIGDTMLSGNVSIPESVGEKIITSFGKKLFYECKEIQKVIIPETVVKLGDAAFCICNSLSEINFPVGLKEIPPDCFNECGFRRLNIPSSIKRIGRGAFINNRKLEEIYLPESLEEISLMTFAGCCAMRKVVLPESLKRIGNGAFSGCTSLEEVDIPLGVNYIGSMAFLSCNNLRKAVIHNNNVEICDMAFSEHTEIIYQS